MSTVTVSLTIDGQQYSPDDATWLSIAPCGCVEGACSVNLGGRLLLDEDAVLGFFYETKRERERVKAQGFTFVLRPRPEVRRLNEPCPHTPQYGIEPLPTPEGHVWATDGPLPKGNLRRHLVPGARNKDAHYLAGDDWRDRWGTAPVTSLCGASGTTWSAHWSTESNPVCTRCEKKGHALVGGAA